MNDPRPPDDLNYPPPQAQPPPPPGSPPPPSAPQYQAWNGQWFNGPPPAAWYQAHDGRWWPQGQAPPLTQPSRPFWQKKRFMIPGGLLAGVVVAAAIVSGPTEDVEPDEIAAVEPEAESAETEGEEEAAAVESTTTTEATTTTAEETTTTLPPLPTIDAGTYIVGTEIPPGVYRVERYWATLDANQEILENELVSDGLALAVITEDATFVEFSGQAIAVEDMPVVDPMLQGFTDGTYLVGADIEPGQYRVSNPGGSAYGARLDSTLDILDNDLNDNSVILTIRETDFAFSISGTLERIG